MTLNAFFFFLSLDQTHHSSKSKQETSKKTKMEDKVQIETFVLLVLFGDLQHIEFKYTSLPIFQQCGATKNTRLSIFRSRLHNKM